VRKIAIFASGTGSNAKKIIEYFRENKQIEVALIVSNRADAPVLNLASANHIESLVLDRPSFYNSSSLLQQLEQHAIDFIVLAGFLWLIPPYLVTAYNRKMINIHPALLPKYGGKGMYGMNVHRAIKAAGEKETGITIHYVNENYDEGNIIFQVKTIIGPTDSPEVIAKKVQQLEHQHFAPVIENLLMEKIEPK
jgi:phosphoribosylglycinamide formyltransferase-1